MFTEVQNKHVLEKKYAHFVFRCTGLPSKYTHGHQILETTLLFQRTLYKIFTFIDLIFTQFPLFSVNVTHVVVDE